MSHVQKALSPNPLQLHHIEDSRGQPLRKYVRILESEGQVVKSINLRKS